MSHFCEIIVILDRPLVQEKMVFKDISYLERQIENLFHTNRTIIWSCDSKQVNLHKQRVITTECMV